jgi:hypothetical protein
MASIRMSTLALVVNNRDRATERARIYYTAIGEEKANI